MGRNNNRMSFGDYMAELSYSLKNHVLDRRRIILPLLLLVAAALTVAAAVFFSVRAVKNREKAEEAAQDKASEDGQKEMELNAYPEVNDLIRMYYDAVAEGDIDTIRIVSRGISDREITDIQVVSSSIDHYETVDGYTKPGSEPREGEEPEDVRSWVVYAATSVIFRGYDRPVPGMQTFFVEEADGGRLAINFEPANMEYINEVSLQDDVVDLSNKITAQYNDMLAEDPAFGTFVDGLTARLYTTAEAKLTQELKQETGAASSGEGNPSGAASAEGGAEDKSPVTGGEDQPQGEDAASGESAGASGEETAGAAGENGQAESAGTGKAIILESVYLRSEASTDSEALTTLYPGFEVEVQENAGEWSKITYEGLSGYIKTEFLRF